MTRREQHKQRQRERLILAGRGLYESGTEVSVARAARAAGLGVATAYRYFPGLYGFLLEIWSKELAREVQP